MTIQSSSHLPPELSDADPRLSAFRTAPHNVEAEKALLGAIFANNRAYEAVSEFLRGEHFALGQNGRVYEACGKLIDRGQIADPVTLRSFFEADEGLAEIGGPAYLLELAGSAVGIINAREYGRVVYDLFLRRELIALGEEVVERAFGGDVEENAVRQIETAEQNLYDLATTGQYEGGFQDFKASVIEAIKLAETAHKRDGAFAGVAAGFTDIDKMLGGLHPSDLIILAGRPSMGKTALATNMAFNAAYSRAQSSGKEGGVVGFFSLEMSAEQLASRILSEQTNISSNRMRKGELTNDEFNRLAVGSQTLHQIPIFIDDTPALTVSALRTRARRLKRQHGLDMIVVDYLQLISASPGSRNDGRVNEVSEITRGLKTLAKELEVPVLALSQLSRAVEQRDNKRPQLSDLRESGSIEQDADVVMFIFREEYYLERDEPVQRQDEKDDAFHSKYERWQQRLEDVRSVAEVIVAKQRHGPIGTVKLHFEGQFTRFGNLEREHGSDF
ncbi:MAG: replicative DNA helicase [Rhodospirillales bacterium]|jgi:replicative DNA helicase|nr:replicative DNA helicase [Rhodospirillales bacterium]